MKKTRRIFIIMLVVIVFLTGCGLWGDKTGARTIKVPSEMPEIVFVKITDYSEIADEDEVQWAITFYDKKGNHCTSEDPYVCGLSYAELVEEYAAGNLDDKIEYHMSCDTNEIFENYKKLCQLSESKTLGMDYPEQVTQEETYRRYWYGLYYDKNGEIQTILLHEYGMGTDYYANDKRADEIYRSYERSFKVLTEEDRIAVIEETGEKYYNNQLIIIFRDKTRKSEIEDLVELFDAEIVSYDKLKNQCLIEFPDMYSLKQLKGISKSLCTYPFVEEVTLHMYDKSDAEEER